MREKCRYLLLPALTEALAEPLTLMRTRSGAQQVPALQSSVYRTVLIEVNSWLPAPVQERGLIPGGTRLG
jgi:hypothetical protein